MKVEPTPALAVDAVAAAALLGISERHLRSLTASGRVPSVRLGHRVVFPVGLLLAMLEREATKTT